MKTNEYYNKRDNYRMSGMRKKLILSCLPKEAGEVLDIGCANGELPEALSARGWQVTGVDISENALQESSPFLKGGGYCFNIEDGNWPDGLRNKKFDLIIASEILEHIFDPQSFVGKLPVLLKSHGKILITTSNVLFWKNRLKFLFGEFAYEKSGLMDYGHVKFFTAKSARELVEKSGLKIIKENNFYPNLYKRGLNAIGNIFPGLLAYNLIFLLEPRSGK